MQCGGWKNASKRTERHGEVFKRIFLTVRSPACQLVLRPHFFCGLFLSDMVTKKSVLLSCSRRHHQNAQWNQTVSELTFKFSTFQKFCELRFFLWNWLKVQLAIFCDKSPEFCGLLRYLNFYKQLQQDSQKINVTKWCFLLAKLEKAVRIKVDKVWHELV